MSGEQGKKDKKKDDSMQEFDIELTVFAKVKVNDEIVNAYIEQYGLPKFVKPEDLNKEIAGRVLFAHISPMISGDVDYDTYFDGVCNMNGLIKDVEVEIDG